MIKPTIGRVVLYNTGRSDQRSPATISYVWPDGRINIGYLYRDGNPGNASKVTLIQEGECPEGCAEWMEYQKIQARKYIREYNRGVK